MNISVVRSTQCCGCKKDHPNSSFSQGWFFSISSRISLINQNLFLDCMVELLYLLSSKIRLFVQKSLLIFPSFENRVNYHRWKQWFLISIYEEGIQRNEEGIQWGLWGELFHSLQYRKEEEIPVGKYSALYIELICLPRKWRTFHIMPTFR